MNLLFLNSIDLKTFGGMEEWIRLVASGLKARGHEITICGRKNSEFLERIKKSNPELDLVGLDISGDFNPVTINNIKKIIGQRQIQTVIVNFNKDIRLGGLAAKLSDDVSVIWSVGLDITKDNLVHKLLTPRLVQGVIVPSEALKKQITRHGYIRPDSIRVIPIGIPQPAKSMSRDTHRAKLLEEFNIPADSFVCVTSGRFVEQKGHEYLIDAAPAIISKNPNVRFLFLGDGPLRERIESKLSELNLQDYIVLTGMRTDVAEILAGCDLMIHPSIDEPFGIAVLEGMRAGLSIVASEVGGLTEVVAQYETGILVEPNNPRDIARAVNDLLSSSAELIEFGLAGTKRWQNHFTYDKMIETIEDYLSELSATVKLYGKTQADRA